MPSERGLSTIPLCLEWYMFVLRTRLSTPAVQCLVLIIMLAWSVMVCETGVRRGRRRRPSAGCPAVYSSTMDASRPRSTLHRTRSTHRSSERSTTTTWNCSFSLSRYRLQAARKHFENNQKHNMPTRCRHIYLRTLS